MTDNITPATDEQIAAWENETHIMPSDLYTFILSLIARIRAETAKNSGVPNLTADEMAEAKRRKYAWALNDAEVISEARELLIELDTFNSMEFDSDAEVACQRSHGIILSLVERLETPSSKPVAWRWRDNEHQTWNFIDFDPVHMDYVYVEPLYATPANSRAENSADMPMADGSDENPMSAAEEVLVWLLIEKIGVPDDVSYTPNQAQKIIEAKLDEVKK